MHARTNAHGAHQVRLCAIFLVRRAAIHTEPLDRHGIVSLCPRSTTPSHERHVCNGIEIVLGHRHPICTPAQYFCACTSFASSMLQVNILATMTCFETPCCFFCVSSFSSQSKLHKHLANSSFPQCALRLLREENPKLAHQKPDGYWSRFVTRNMACKE